MTSFCVDLTDKALSVALADQSNSTSKVELDAIYRNRKDGGDFSVAYALHYPNFEGGASPLPMDLTGEVGINVKVTISWSHLF